MTHRSLVKRNWSSTGTCQKTGTFKSMVIYPSSVMICSFALTASLGVFATFVVVVANNVVVYYDDDDDDDE